MGPNNPWSPAWRPDPTGNRLAAIRAARRGAVLAGIVYLPIGAAALVPGPLVREGALMALVVGLPGVALLGAGLAPATLGSRIDAVVVGLAFAIGAPVAAVTSIVIGAFLLDVFTAGGTDLAGPILRAGVSGAVGVAPLVGLGAACWVGAVRWLSRTRELAS
jgi:hypothetical protein